MDKIHTCNDPFEYGIRMILSKRIWLLMHMLWTFFSYTGIVVTVIFLVITWVMGFRIDIQISICKNKYWLKYKNLCIPRGILDTCKQYKQYGTYLPSEMVPMVYHYAWNPHAEFHLFPCSVPLFCSFWAIYYDWKGDTFVFS